MSGFADSRSAPDAMTTVSSRRSDGAQAAAINIVSAMVDALRIAGIITPWA